MVLTSATLSRRRSRASVALGLTAAAAVVLAACGSGGGSSTASSPAAALASAPASAAGLAAARQAVAAALRTPTRINQTVPLAAAPARGKTLVFIQCELAACADIGSGVQAGAKAVGWSYKQLSFTSSNPSSLVTAMQQALQYHPFAVSFSGIPEALWASEVPAYQRAGVLLLPVVTGPLTTSATVPVNIGDFTAGGEALGNWFVADSAGKGKALIVNLPAFPVLTEYATGMRQAISANCPACSTTSFDGTLAEITSGQFVPSIVTALKKDPSITYVLVSDDIFISSLPSALKAAGLNGIKVAGGQPEPSDLANIRNGSESAAVLVSNQILGWMVVDSAARLSEGMTVPSGDGGAPLQLLTAANVGSPDLAAHVAPADYPQQFSALWKVG